MGLIKQGILGGFRKKTGTVIGSYWRKLDVIRALPRSSGKAQSAAQIEQQLKFALVTGFLSNFSELIDRGYRSIDTDTQMNKAVGYHLKNAVLGNAPDFEIDLTKLMLSMGKLDLPDSATAQAAAAGKVRFVWDVPTEAGKFISPVDTITIVAYNANKKKIVKRFAATTRETGEFELQMPNNYHGDTVHLYISFTSKVKKLNSNTMYLGTVTVSF